MTLTTRRTEPWGHIYAFLSATLPTHVLTACNNPVWVLGHCPCCHGVVLSTEDAVWTCPADLSEGNPHREEAHPDITEELQECEGVFSNCGEDFGFPCHEPMPLHEACYGHGHY